jgi:hypothetical protein
MTIRSPVCSCYLIIGRNCFAQGLGRKISPVSPRKSSGYDQQFAIEAMAIDSEFTH